MDQLRLEVRVIELEIEEVRAKSVSSTSPVLTSKEHEARLLRAEIQHYRQEIELLARVTLGPEAERMRLEAQYPLLAKELQSVKDEAKVIQQLFALLII